MLHEPTSTKPTAVVPVQPAGSPQYNKVTADVKRFSKVYNAIRPTPDDGCDKASRAMPAATELVMKDVVGEDYSPDAVKENDDWLERDQIKFIQVGQGNHCDFGETDNICRFSKELTRLIQLPSLTR